MVCALQAVFVYAVGGVIASAATSPNVVDAGLRRPVGHPADAKHGLRLPRLRLQIPRSRWI